MTAIEVDLKHLFICREYPPAAYPPGGIGTYVRHMATLLADAGETVHVIAHRWGGAPNAREERMSGHLIIHRVALDGWRRDGDPRGEQDSDSRVARGMLKSAFPVQAFSWQAALLAERLIAEDGIDVVEGQEWEAPLYYLQVRRQLGLGPSRRPPCVVHLHSSTEQIFAANDWDTSVLDYAPAADAEAYSIVAADALLSPSHFVAEQAVLRYGIERSRIQVVPYPIGQTMGGERTSQVWAGQTVCHVGRLEPRKGVLELADAVAMLAAEFPDLRLEFVGGDTPLGVTGGVSVGDAIRARVPKAVRDRFRFHGSCSTEGMTEVLASACAAIVPSRWENFPYSCIESMNRGLPIVASPNGGMRELVTDGVTGWIAPDSTARGLAAALKRMLDVGAEQRASMGAAARNSVGVICANDTAVRRHLELKHRLAEKAANGARWPWPSESAAAVNGGGDESYLRQSDPDVSPCRIGLVVSYRSEPGSLQPMLLSIRAQSEIPAAVCVVGHGAADEDLARFSGEGWGMVSAEVGVGGRSELAAASKLLLRDNSISTIIFLDARVVLDPAFLSVCSGVLAQEPELGIVGVWLGESPLFDRIHFPACPSLPHLLTSVHPMPCVAVRSEALTAAMTDLVTGSVCPRAAAFEHVGAAGWRGRTYPAALASIDPAWFRALEPTGWEQYSSMAQAIRRQHTPLLHWIRESSAAERRELLRRALREPLNSARWWIQHAVLELRQAASRARAEKSARRGPGQSGDR